jgi:hypothetical protein
VVNLEWWMKLVVVVYYMYEVVGWGGRWKGLGDGWMDVSIYIYIYDFSNVESLYVIIIIYYYINF